MATWGSFVIEQEYVVLITAKKSTTNCFIKPEIILGEWDLKRRKSHNQLISRGEGSPHNEGEPKDQTGQLNDTYTTVIPPSTAHTSGTKALRMYT